ncbi:hypothetical protein [Dactylosporangium sp. NPDC000521]|uniref:hypothetical protein n=1 Tax=Dactylosporangium sp. NPDC000521 TaxID=3363975 RepID=UPI00369E6EA9
MRRSSTGRRWLALAVVATLAASGCTDDSDRGDTAARGAVDRKSVAAAAAGLPAEPAAAAEQLVATITSDPAGAPAATAELLRRSGFAIVSAKGPVVAAPDEVTLLDAPIYAELVPLLAEATREGDRYTPEQFSALLVAVGLTDKAPTFAQLATAIGGWGKQPGDGAVFTTAGAAVRALAAQHRQVIHPAADPAEVWFDPLQTILLLSHATSRFALVAKGAKNGTAAPAPGLLDRLVGGGVAHAEDPKGACGEFAALFAAPDDPVIKANSDFLKGELKDRLAGAILGEGAKEIFDKANEAWGKAGATASAIMLMLGTRIDLTADKSATHFKHAPGSRGEHVTLTATAIFDIKVALEKLECYALAGVEMPKAGPMEGLTVRWSSQQPQVGTIQKGGGQLLQAVAADSAKMTRGEKTGKDGKSTLEVKPPVEDPPGEGPELRGKATFIAALDKESFPFELGDTYGLLGNPVGYGIGKTFDLLRDVLVKAGLPSQTITVAVTYHGSDILVAKGSNSVNLILASIPKVYVDLVSCTGLAGPFKGKGGYSGVEYSEFEQLAGAVAGIPVPKSIGGQENSNLSVLTNDRSGPNPFFIMTGEGGKQFLDGVLDLNPDRYLNTRAEILDDWRVGRPVGEVEILLAGNSFPLSDLTWPVLRVTEDPRCPKVTYEYDNL